MGLVNFYNCIPISACRNINTVNFYPGMEIEKNILNSYIDSCYRYKNQ